MNSMTQALDDRNKLDMLENLFSEYLMQNIDQGAFEKKLSVVLASTCSVPDESLPDKSFSIKVVYGTGNTSFFGFRIFPDLESLILIAQNTIDGKGLIDLSRIWMRISKWVIEVDDRCLSRDVAFNPKELTALVLHEISYVVYSYSALEKFVNAFKKSYIQMSVANKASLKYLYMLYAVPLSTACMLHSLGTQTKDGKITLITFDSVMRFGYESHLVTAVTKIIETYGNNDSFSTEAENIARIESLIKWANVTVGDWVIRKRHLKDTLYVQAVRTASDYIKALAVYLMTTFGVKLRENYTGYITEAATAMETISKKTRDYYSTLYDLEASARINKAVESAIRFSDPMKIAEMRLSPAVEGKNFKKYIPSQYMVDAIAVEVDKMENHSDRMYVLDMIYNLMEDLCAYKDVMDADTRLKSKYGQLVDSMLKQLEVLRTDVLGRRSFASKYQLYVKVPRGYEG